MDNYNKSYAVLLLNLGGPTSKDDIKPFLKNLFMDKDILSFPVPFLQGSFASIISSLRASSVAKKYALIGGGSPILRITNEQALCLEKELSANINANVYVAMRYTKPFIEDSIRKIIKDKRDFIIVLPLYPHYSITTTGSSLNELERVIKRIPCNIPFGIIRQWYDYPPYIESLCDLISKALSSYSSFDKVNLLFSAHSVPMSIIREGDPYDEHIKASVSAIMKHFTNPYYICYQSKVAPLKWLSPSTKDTIRLISGKDKEKDILVIPISFVSDHYETSYEIDIEYKEQAESLGIKSFSRIEALNTNIKFIKTLYKLVMDFVASTKKN